jgi:hypothetical protein
MGHKIPQSKLIQINHISINENEKVKIRPGRYKIIGHPRPCEFFLSSQGFNVHWVAFILTLIWLAWVYGIVGEKIRLGPLIVKGRSEKTSMKLGIAIERVS